MRILIITVVVFSVSTLCNAQTEQANNNVLEQQLENTTAQNEDVETEDDRYLQQLHYFLKHPLDLNAADAQALNELNILSPLQVQQFLSYRNLLGRLIDVYELQAVPGWDLRTITRLRPYVVAGPGNGPRQTISSRLRNGEHSLLVRASQVLERAKGFLPDPTATADHYWGSQQKILLRYKYVYRNLLQYGIVAEKDAGEQFFKGKQRMGFDFYSVHVFIRNTGIIRSLAVGDYSVNLGQGLIQWQGLAFKKSVDAVNIKRESPVLRPYNSAGEINFHRGAGITLAKGKWQATLFFSYRKVDANYVSDTLQGWGEYVSSLQTSGYHRTKSETADKGIQRQLAVGGTLSYRYKNLQVGLNGIHYALKYPILKSPDPYNKYALSGKNFGNYSIDYGYTFRNVHLFGEVAFTSSLKMAMLSGMVAAVSSRVDLALLYRNISPAYQTLYASAFTENTSPVNEKGFYAGVTVRPSAYCRIDAYADIYKFPWLKYRVDGPSAGSDYLVQFSYQPNKRTEIYTRYHSESKQGNEPGGDNRLAVLAKQPKKNWRTHVSHQFNREMTIRSRVEMTWFDKNGPDPGHGFLFYADLLYRPPLKPYSGSLRFQYFQTDNYNSRLYAYENDVLYAYSTPVFYDKGLRYYINLAYEMTERLSFWVRWSQTIYPGKTLIGSGLDEIDHNHKTEVKFQALYVF